MTKRYNVQVTVAAKRDIVQIWEHIAQDNPRAATSLIGALREKIASLASFPARHPLIPEAHLLRTAQYRHLVYQHYRIVYRIEHNTVYILCVFHGAKLLDLPGR